MAQISATELFRFENFNPEIAGKVVGHNRTVGHVARPGSRMITGSLHGNIVFTLTRFDILKDGDPEYYLRLSTAGHPTPTTRQAIKDFLEAAGFRAEVSMAKKALAVWVFYKDGKEVKLQSSDRVATMGIYTEDFAKLTTTLELED